MLASGVPTTKAVRPGSDSLIAGPTRVKGNLSSHDPDSFFNAEGGVGATGLVDADAEGDVADPLGVGASTVLVTVRLGPCEDLEQALIGATDRASASATTRTRMYRP